jgi:hypothetical protein
MIRRRDMNGLPHCIGHEKDGSALTYEKGQGATTRRITKLNMVWKLRATTFELIVIGFSAAKKGVPFRNAPVGCN